MELSVFRLPLPLADCALSCVQEKEEGKEDSLEEDKETESSRGRKKKVGRQS